MILHPQHPPPLYQQNYPVGLAVELVIFYMTWPRLWWRWDRDLFLCGICAPGRLLRVRIPYAERGEARPPSWIIMIYGHAERKKKKKQQKDWERNREKGGGEFLDDIIIAKYNENGTKLYNNVHSHTTFTCVSSLLTFHFVVQLFVIVLRCYVVFLSPLVALSVSLFTLICWQGVNEKYLSLQYQK